MDDIDGLLRKLKEIEELMTFPTVPGHVDRAGELAMSIARAAPHRTAAAHGSVADLAMKVVSEVNAMRATQLPLSPSNGRLNAALWRLRLALQQAKSRRQ